MGVAFLLRESRLVVARAAQQAEHPLYGAPHRRIAGRGRTAPRGGLPDAGELPRSGGLPDAGGLPRARGFLAAFVFGDKALAAIRAGKFPPAVMELIASARKYAEGTGVRLEVKGPKDVDVVKKLAAIKVAN